MKWKAINEICCPKQWKTIAINNLKKEGFPVYGANGVIGYYNEYTHNKPTVMITCRGATCGAINISEGPAYINGNAMALDDLNERIVNIHYLYYYLSFYDFSDIISGSAQPQITKTHLNRLKVPIPLMEIQMQIVETFNEIKKQIDAHNEQLGLLNALIKSRFIEMFGDPAENPYGWHQTTLKEVGIGKLSYGAGASSCEYDGSVRYVRITDINDSGQLNSDYVSPTTVDEKHILYDGDILFARSGATVGKTYRYRESDGKCVYAGYLIRLVPNQDIVLPDYLFHYTKTSYYESFVTSSMKIVAQPNINAKQYGDLIITTPPIELQCQFVNLIDQVDKSKFEVQKGIDKLELLKNSLMQQYFG